MRKHILTTVSLLTLGFAPAAFAADTAGDFGFVAEVDLEFGGDEVATVAYTNGDTQSIKAGQGVAFAVGAHYQPSGSPIDFSGTIGYKFVSTAADNADIGIDRVVIELLAIYDPSDAWWVAAGPVWHNGVKFDADGFGQDIDLGDATGLTLQAGWKWFGITYTNMEYTEETTGYGFKVDASSFGLTFRWRG